MKRDTIALYFAARHPDTPVYAKLLAGLVAAYALSPIDLIPDFIPVLGYLDDLLIVPAGIALCVRLIPTAVMAECRERAEDNNRPTSVAAAVAVVLVWLVIAFWLVSVIAKMAGR